VHQGNSSRVRTGTIALSLGLSLGAGLLIAPPASAAPATVVPAAAAASVKPKLTNSASTYKLAWGARVRFAAKLRDPRSGKAIRGGQIKLQQYRSGKWRTLGAKKLSSKGTSNFSAWPHSNTSFRTYYTGAGQFRAVAGRTLKVRVVASGKKIISEAQRHKGALYKYGASGPKRFDCSGFTLYVFKKAAGRKLPHKANSQQRYGKKVSQKNKRVGDLIVMRSGSYGYHAGIYAGGGYLYDSPHSGARVGKHKIWSKNYVVRRLAAV
jgi:cell wall-associated NlpC family hydrolase